MSDKKKKKNKTVYYDDGRTIYDMSGVGGRSNLDPNLQLGRPRATLKEQFRTYIAAVKTMILPMLMTLGIISVAFLFLYIILELAS